MAGRVVLAIFRVGGWLYLESQQTQTNCLGIGDYARFCKGFYNHLTFGTQNHKTWIKVLSPKHMGYKPYKWRTCGFPWHFTIYLRYPTTTTLDLLVYSKEARETPQMLEFTITKLWFCSCLLGVLEKQLQRLCLNLAISTKSYCSERQASPQKSKKKHMTHRIHVWYIYLHLGDFYGKCRQIYHTWILWVMLQLLVPHCGSVLLTPWLEIFLPPNPFQCGTLEHKVYIMDFCKFSLERRPDLGDCQVQC